MPRERDPTTGRWAEATANETLGEEIPQTVRQDSFSPSVFRFPMAAEVRQPLFPEEGDEEEKKVEHPSKGSAANNNEWALKMFAARNKGVITYRDDIETFVNAGSLDSIDSFLVSSLREFHPCATNLFDQLCKQNPRMKKVTDQFRKEVQNTDSAAVVKKGLNVYFHKLLSQLKCDHYTAVMFTIIVLSEKSKAEFEGTSGFVFARKCLRLVREYAFTGRESIHLLGQAAKMGELLGAGAEHGDECVSTGEGFDRMLSSNADLCTDVWSLWEMLEDYMGFEPVKKKSLKISAKEAHDRFWIDEDVNKDHSLRQGDGDTLVDQWEKFGSRYEILRECAQESGEAWRLKMENDLVENFRRMINRKYWLKMVTFMEEKEILWDDMTMKDVWNAVLKVEKKMTITENNFKDFPSQRKNAGQGQASGGSGQANQSNQSAQANKSGVNQQRTALRAGSINVPCRYGDDCRKLVKGECPFQHEKKTPVISSNSTAVTDGAPAEVVMDGVGSDGEKVQIAIPKPKNRFGSRRVTIAPGFMVVVELEDDVGSDVLNQEVFSQETIDCISEFDALMAEVCYEEEDLTTSLSGEEVLLLNRLMEGDGLFESDEQAQRHVFSSGAEDDGIVVRAFSPSGDEVLEGAIAFMSDDPKDRVILSFDTLSSISMLDDTIEVGGCSVVSNEVVMITGAGGGKRRSDKVFGVPVALGNPNAVLTTINGRVNDLGGTGHSILMGKKDLNEEVKGYDIGGSFAVMKQDQNDVKYSRPVKLESQQLLKRRLGMKPITVVSTGDGCATGYMALTAMGFYVEKYYSIEIDPKRRAVADNIVPVGVMDRSLGNDVCSMDFNRLDDIECVDVWLGTPRCVAWSRCLDEKDLLGFESERALDFQASAVLLHQCLMRFPEMRFLFETNEVSDKKGEVWKKEQMQIQEDCVHCEFRKVQGADFGSFMSRPRRVASKVPWSEEEKIGYGDPDHCLQEGWRAVKKPTNCLLASQATTDYPVLVCRNTDVMDQRGVFPDEADRLMGYETGYTDGFGKVAVSDEDRLRFAGDGLVMAIYWAVFRDVDFGGGEKPMNPVNVFTTCVEEITPEQIDLMVMNMTDGELDDWVLGRRGCWDPPEHEIMVPDDSFVYKTRTPFPIPPKTEAPFLAKMKYLCSVGQFEEITGTEDPEQWESPVFGQLKPGKINPDTRLTDVRILCAVVVLNDRAVLDPTLKEYCPNKEQFLGGLEEDDEYFGFVDDRDAFQNAAVKKKSWKYMGLVCKVDRVIRKWKAKVCIQGLASSALWYNYWKFCIYMKILGRLFMRLFISWVDDLIVKGPTKERAGARRRLVCSIHRVFDIPISPKCSDEIEKRVKGAGFMIEKGGISPDEKLSEALGMELDKKIRGPKQARQLRGILNQSTSSFQLDLTERHKWGEWMHELNQASKMETVPMEVTNKCMVAQQEMKKVIGVSKRHHYNPNSLITEQTCIIFCGDISDVGRSMSLYKCNVADARDVNVPADLEDERISMLVDVTYGTLRDYQADWMTVENELDNMVVELVSKAGFLVAACAGFQHDGIPKVGMYTDAKSAAQGISNLHLPSGKIEFLTAKARKVAHWRDDIAYTKLLPIYYGDLPGIVNCLADSMSKLHAEMVLRARDDRMKKTLEGEGDQASSFAGSAKSPAMKEEYGDSYDDEYPLEAASSFMMEVGGWEGEEDLPRFPRSSMVEEDAQDVSSWVSVTKNGKSGEKVKVWTKPQGYNFEKLNLSDSDWKKVVEAYAVDDSEFLRVKMSVVYSATVFGEADSKLEKERVLAWSSKVFPITVVDGLQPALFVPTVRQDLDFRDEKEEVESQTLILLVPAGANARITGAENFTDKEEDVDSYMYRDLRADMMLLQHEFSLHAQVMPMMMGVMRYGFWPSLYADLKEHIKWCSLCMANWKIRSQSGFGLTGLIQYKHVGCDHAPHPDWLKKITGMAATLTFYDYASGDIELAQVEDMTPECFGIHLLVDWIKHRGLMVSLKTDQGSSFTAKVVEVVVKIYGIKVHNFSAVGLSTDMGGTEVSNKYARKAQTEAGSKGDVHSKLQYDMYLARMCIEANQIRRRGGSTVFERTRGIAPSVLGDLVIQREEKDWEELLRDCPDGIVPALASRVKELTESFNAEKMIHNYLATFRTDANKARSLVKDVLMEVGQSVTYLNKQKNIAVGTIASVDVLTGIPRTAMVRVGSEMKKVQYQHLRPMAADRTQLTMPHLEKPVIGDIIFFVGTADLVYAGRVINSAGDELRVQEYEASDEQALWWYPLWQKAKENPKIQKAKPDGWDPVITKVDPAKVEVIGSLSAKSQKLTEDTILRLQAKNLM
jgi:hypothetical protein